MRNWLLQATLIAGLLLVSGTVLAERPDGRDSKFAGRQESREDTGKTDERRYSAQKSGKERTSREASRDKWQGSKWRPGTSERTREASPPRSGNRYDGNRERERPRYSEHRSGGHRDGARRDYRRDQQRDNRRDYHRDHQRDYQRGYRPHNSYSVHGGRTLHLGDARRHVDYHRRFSNHYKPGYRLQHLPHHHTRIWYRNRDYYYFGGSFFLPASYGYYVVNAPIGARIRVLPHGYLSFYLGHNHYYYYNDIYYRHIPDTREYVVVEPPEGAEEALMAAADQGSNLYVYPNEGQSAETQERDRYDCHLWAVDQTDYEPGLEGQEPELADDYRRALSACLEGRGYTVK